MPNLNDTYASLLSAYSGSVNDKRSASLTDVLGYAKPLSLNDMEAAALASLGYTGALNDAWDKYIKALGGFGISVKADYLLSTFYGNPVPVPVPFLFASAQPGFWYDPSDLTTMFQDNLGSTPVTAPGQTVGLLLDKSQNGVGTNGSSRRNLLVATATLSTQSVTVTAVAHTLSFTGTGTVTLTGASIAGPLIGTGASNRVSLTFTPTAGSLTLTVLGSVTLAQLEIGSTATAYQPITTSWSATLAGSHATQATSTQRPIYGINPIVGTRNLLTYTEQFDNAAWTKSNATITADTAIAPDGTTTADSILDTAVSNIHYCAQSMTALSPSGKTYTVSAYGKANTLNYMTLGISDISSGSLYATAVFNLSTGAVSTSGAAGTGYSVVSSSISSVGSGWYRCVVTVVAGTSVSFLRAVVAPNKAGTISAGAGGMQSYLGNGSGFYAWGIQLEQASAVTAYQKVVSQYEVTEVGVASVSYIAFDGVDDGMVTSTITPGTDKVQVFAGVRKLSDAAQKIVAELSATIASNAGAFALTAPNSAAANYNFSSKGTTQTDNVVTTYTAPVTSVISGFGDIAGASNLIRVNGSQVGSTLTTQGTGNYLAYPLYIGRRGGSTLPYNGRFYSMIVRFGTNLTTGQITSTETYVNGKTGAY
jgi:hypothetical protein